MSDPWVDCGDNSCICCPPEQRKGMRTNGGCRCFRSGNFLSLSSDENRKVRRAVLYWRQRALDAERQLTGEILRPGEVFKLSDPEFMGEFQTRPADLQVEDVEESSKKLGWTCYERHGWEIKMPPADFEQQLEKLETDEEKLALIGSFENMTDARDGKKVLVMGLLGWMWGVVTEKSDLVPYWHVDTGGSVFPLEMAGDERNCWVTTSQINKKCFQMELKR